MSTVFQSVNSFCLNKIIALSDRSEVVAAQDIYDQSGVKLWAKGGRMDSGLQARLANRKLRTPLELSLELERGLSTGDIVADCLELIQSTPLLARLSSNRTAVAALSRLRMVRLPTVLRLLVSASYELKEGPAYQHALHTLAVSAGYAAHANLPPQDIDALLCSAILHDLGELYVNPAFFEPARPLTPREWLSVATHPKVSYLVTRELGKLPDAVGVAVSQHHERMDGSGYPLMLPQSKISKVGGILAAADATAAIIRRPGLGNAYRAALAIRVVPAEFDKGMKSFVCSAFGAYAEDRQPDHTPCLDLVKQTIAALEQHERTVALIAADASGALLELVSIAREVGANIRKAVRSTGVEFLLNMPEASAEADASWDEVRQVLQEANWRLRNVSRNVQLRYDSLTPAEQAAIAPLMPQVPSR